MPTRGLNWAKHCFSREMSRRRSSISRLRPGWGRTNHIFITSSLAHISPRGAKLMHRNILRPTNNSRTKSEIEREVRLINKNPPQRRREHRGFAEKSSRKFLFFFLLFFISSVLFSANPLCSLRLCGESAFSKSPMAIRLVDITSQAGITFKHISSPEKKYIVESMSGGVALFDYDNDGLLDIFLVN